MNPLNMQVICNIQAMSITIGAEIFFHELENKSYSELADIQEKMIPIYNAKVNEVK